MVGEEYRFIGVRAAREERRGRDRGWGFAQLTVAARDDGAGAIPHSV
jgi:hypothetical protein